MKRKFLITPGEGKKNEVEVTFQEEVKLKVDKRDKVFVKFLMMMLHYGGGASTYFAPLLDFTDRTFYDIKKKVTDEGIKALFHADTEKQLAKEIKEPDIGKIIALIVENPTDSNKKIADKFNATSTNKVSFKSVEEIRNKFGLKTS